MSIVWIVSVNVSKRMSELVFFFFFLNLTNIYLNYKMNLKLIFDSHEFLDIQQQTNMSLFWQVMICFFLLIFFGQNFSQLNIPLSKQAVCCERNAAVTCFESTTQTTGKSKLRLDFQNKVGNELQALRKEKNKIKWNEIWCDLYFWCNFICFKFILLSFTIYS